MNTLQDENEKISNLLNRKFNLKCIDFLSGEAISDLFPRARGPISYFPCTQAMTFPEKRNLETCEIIIPEAVPNPITEEDLNIDWGE